MMKRYLLIILCLISVGIMCGASDKVELRDQGKLIDLDKAMDIKPGGSSIIDIDGDEGGEDTETGTSASEEPSDAPSEIQISIRDTTVTYNGEPIEADVFEKRIRKDHERGATFLLVDDYADSKSYKNVLRFLRGLKEEIHLEFHETVSDMEE